MRQVKSMEANPKGSRWEWIETREEINKIEIKQI